MELYLHTYYMSQGDVTIIIIIIGMVSLC